MRLNILTYVLEVLTYLDVRNWEYEPVSATSLQVGDKVEAADGQIATIIRKANRDNRSVLEISTENNKMLVTPSHRVLIPSSNRDHAEVRAQDLKKGDLVMTA